MIFAAPQRAIPRIGDAVQVGNWDHFCQSNSAPSWSRHGGIREQDYGAFVITCELLLKRDLG
jgi:hypothetical protein